MNRGKPRLPGCPRLLTHEAAGLRDRGVAGTLAWDPPPSNGRGPKLTLTQSIGAGASGGKDALLSRTTLEGLAANDTGGPRHLYEGIYCARGQAENLIKLHKVQLASDRTSCQSPLANQFRLVLHTAAYWLMLALRDAVPRRMPLAWSEFATIRRSLLKIGARVVEKAARIRIHFASACPDAALFRMLAGRLAASGP